MLYKRDYIRCPPRDAPQQNNNQQQENNDDDALVMQNHVVIYQPLNIDGDHNRNSVNYL